MCGFSTRRHVYPLFTHRPIYAYSQHTPLCLHHPHSRTNSQTQPQVLGNSHIRVHPHTCVSFMWPTAVIMVVHAHLYVDVLAFGHSGLCSHRTYPAFHAHWLPLAPLLACLCPSQCWPFPASLAQPKAGSRMQSNRQLKAVLRAKLYFAEKSEPLLKGYKCLHLGAGRERGRDVSQGTRGHWAVSITDDDESSKSMAVSK